MKNIYPLVKKVHCWNYRPKKHKQSTSTNQIPTISSIFTLKKIFFAARLLELFLLKINRILLKKWLR